jgi:hypothetical protein
MVTIATPRRESTTTKVSATKSTNQATSSAIGTYFP